MDRRGQGLSLTLARRDLETARPRRLRWIGHFATAGVAVIAVSVWLLQDPAPTTPAGDDALRIAAALESGSEHPILRIRNADQAHPMTALT